MAGQDAEGAAVVLGAHRPHVANVGEERGWRRDRQVQPLAHSVGSAGMRSAERAASSFSRASSSAPTM